MEFIAADNLVEPIHFTLQGLHTTISFTLVFEHVVRYALRLPTVPSTIYTLAGGVDVSPERRLVRRVCIVGYQFECALFALFEKSYTIGVHRKYHLRVM